MITLVNSQQIPQFISKMKDFHHYKTAFSGLHTARSHGKPAPHKALLLLTVIDMVESGQIKDNRIELTDQLEQHFVALSKKYIGKSLLFRPNIGMPYYHMQHEGFWHLIPKDGHDVFKSSQVRYSKTWLNNEFSHAQLDAELFELLQNEGVRAQLRVLLISTYLTGQPVELPLGMIVGLIAGLFVA